jgi:hypothetical protein
MAQLIQSFLFWSFDYLISSREFETETMATQAAADPSTARKAIFVMTVAESNKTKSAILTMSSPLNMQS